MFSLFQNEHPLIDLKSTNNNYRYVYTSNFLELENIDYIEILRKNAAMKSTI
jgi:hypothetical protein